MNPGEQREEHERHDQDGAQMLRRVVRPEGPALDVHVEIRNEDQRDNDEGGDQDAGHKRREKVQQFLEAQKVPRRFGRVDRKSTRLNSSHANISYAVFCLKKKKQKKNINTT